MRFLQRKFDVDDALRRRLRAGDRRPVRRTEGGRPVDWFYYVNGIEADRGRRGDASSHAGDRVWWDRHDWGAASDVPAVVGSFPEPFLPAPRASACPTRIACADDAGAACDEAESRLARRGLNGSRASALGTGGGTETLRVLVGPWSRAARRPRRPAHRAGPRRRAACSRSSRREGRRLDAARRPRPRRAPAWAPAAASSRRRACASSSRRGSSRGPTPPGALAAAARSAGERAAQPLRAGRRGSARVPCRSARGAGVVIYRRRATPLHAARAAAGCAVLRRAGHDRARREQPVRARRRPRRRRWPRRRRRRGARAAPRGLDRACRSACSCRRHQPDRRPQRAHGRGSPRDRAAGSGQLDITLEAVVYGLMLGLRAVVLIAAFALYSRRRRSRRGAAAVPARVVPLARSPRSWPRGWCRCWRATLGAWPRRSAAGRRVRRRGSRSCARWPAGALDRAVDVAATLEVRGYGARARGRRVAPAVVAPRHRLRRCGRRRSSP